MGQYFEIVVENGIAILTLDETDARVNTVSPGWITALTAAFERFRDDAAITGIVIRSAKPGFMAGADLKYILKEAVGLSIPDALEFSQRPTQMHRLIETCGKPVVAAIEGFALGGGYELALACTRRIVADTAKAVVGLPEVSVGLLPGSGGTQRLLRMIGVERAADVLLGGKSYSPQEALSLGLVDELAPPGAVLEAAKAWLAGGPDPTRDWDRKGYVSPGQDGLLRQSTATFFTMQTGKLRAKYGANYPAPIAILSSLFEGMQVSFDKGCLVESRYFAKLLLDPVSRNIIRTMFVNKGIADKGGARPAGTPKFQPARIGVLGAGMMGAGIAYVSAKAGIDVVLLDRDLETAQKGKAYSQKILDKAIAKGTATAQSKAELLDRIVATASFADLAGVDAVVEAVFEDTAIKADITRKTLAVTGDAILFASNTSTLPIAQLAEASSRPENFIGLHFFSPVDRMALVEMISGDKTSDETRLRAQDLIRAIRKTPISVNDSRGFYTSRVFQTFIHEGAQMLREGIAPAIIENTAKQAGMPVGPLALLDEVTLDLPLKIVQQSEAEDDTFVRPDSIAVLEKMIAIGRSSRKAGGGFYDYSAEGEKRLWRGLTDLFPIRIENPDVEELKRRFLYIQSIETMRCFEEDVLTHPADADIGAVLGWGYPAWTGGTLSLIETVGLPTFTAECDRLAQKYGARFLPPAKLRAMASEHQEFDWS